MVAGRELDALVVRDELVASYRAVLDDLYQERRMINWAIAYFQRAADTPAKRPDKPGVLRKRPDGKDPAAVALGRLGGLKGGKARAASMSPERRREIAQTAAKARWDK